MTAAALDLSDFALWRNSFPVLVVPDEHQHGPAGAEQAAQADFHRVQPAGYRQARRRHPGTRRPDEMAISLTAR